MDKAGSSIGDILTNLEVDTAATIIEASCNTSHECLIMSNVSCHATSDEAYHSVDWPCGFAREEATTYSFKMAKTAGSLVIALNAEDPLNRTVLA